MSNDEQAIRQLIETWLAATRDGGIDTVLGLMTEDVVFLTPGQAPMIGRDAFAAGLRPMLATHTIASSSAVEEIAVVGDMAYSRTRLAITVTPKVGGEPMRRAGHTLSVLRKGGDGKWRITRDANLLGPA